MLKRRYWFLFAALFIFLFVSGCSNEKETGQTESKNNLILITGDTVSEKGGCVLASRFAPGDKIVFRMNAINPDTGLQMENAKLQVHLSTGEVLDMVYGEHPPGVENAAKFWTAAYPVTKDTPKGKLEYFVTAEAGDRKGEFRPFNVEPSLLMIVDEKAAGSGSQGQQQGNANQSGNKNGGSQEANLEPNNVVNVEAVNFAFNKDKYYVKAGKEVTIHLTSKEGTHGIAIPDLNVSIDEPNGTVKFTPTKPGEYEMVCSVFCGAGHGDMKATLVVVE